MKTVSVALKAHLAGSRTTRAVCLRLTRTDGVVLGMTMHDRDLTIDGVVYLTAAGGATSDAEDTAAFNVDNASQRGILSSVSITEDDLRAGLWDGAIVNVFVVNWADLTQGSYRQRDGWLGQITTDRLQFTAELRGMMQALQTTFGRLCNPSCDANLGDARCGVNLGFAGDSPETFTRAGTLTGVDADNATLYDTGRTEPGPAGGVAITGISNANPCVITTATALALPNGSPVTLSGIVGPSALNGVTTIRNVSGATFELDIDTTSTADYPAYGGTGGVATPLGAESGYFDYGLFTATSGLSIGRSMEIKSYVPGQFVLQLPMPYTMAIGDTYTVIAGCDKNLLTCITKFNNVINFRGFPYVPGQDKLSQVGRRS